MVIILLKGLKVLKIYTANAYGLDKKSKVMRLEWVEKYLQDILDVPNNDIWLSAEEPLIFLACALELQGYYKNPGQFISRLPILLDGTCNGLQHLSAIANDINLAEKVNICSSSEIDIPKDVYCELINPIKESISEIIAKDSNYYNLSKVNITRKLIKRGIMTISYGVTVEGINKQLKSEFFHKPNLINRHYIYKPKDSSVGNIALSTQDIYKLAEVIYKSLFKTHSILEDIMNYFRDMVKLLNELELPVTWITPSGVKLAQRYSKFTKYDIISIVQGKRKKITLSKTLLDKNNIIKINTLKQVNSFVPNFIHSMDASTIIVLINNIQENFGFEVVTIHDCFAVHANYADILSRLVKESFILIYTDENCIEKFHSYVINTIQAVYDVIEDKDEDEEKNEKKWKYYCDRTRWDKWLVINKKGDMLPIPEKPIIGEMNLRKQLIDSVYFIN